MVPFTTMVSVVFLEISLELALMLMGMGLVRGVLTICTDMNKVVDLDVIFG
jgi:hypothetical protein